MILCQTKCFCVQIVVVQICIKRLAITHLTDSNQEVSKEIKKKKKKTDKKPAKCFEVQLLGLH